METFMYAMIPQFVRILMMNSNFKVYVWAPLINEKFDFLKEL